MTSKGREIGHFPDFARTCSVLPTQCSWSWAAGQCMPAAECVAHDCGLAICDCSGKERAPWQILNLSIDEALCPDAIKKAFYASARRFHPDKNPGCTQLAQAEFLAAHRARNRLMDLAVFTPLDSCTPPDPSNKEGRFSFMADPEPLLASFWRIGVQWVGSAPARWAKGLRHHALQIYDAASSLLSYCLSHPITVLASIIAMQLAVNSP